MKLSYTRLNQRFWIRAINKLKLKWQLPRRPSRSLQSSSTLICRAYGILTSWASQTNPIDLRERTIRLIVLTSSNTRVSLKAGAKTKVAVECRRTCSRLMKTTASLRSIRMLVRETMRAKYHSSITAN